MRILCLDVGDKNIGIALSDPTLSIAQAFKLFKRNSYKKDLLELKHIIEENDVQKIVIGLPKDLNGGIGKRAEMVMEFADGLKHFINLPVEFWDERFSSNEAHRVFEMAQVSHKKRKPFIDMIASQLILQGYLDAQKKG
ncbi:MAG TPA: Holliday junction resolvase RuvX [Syntrophorhabdaceae bacterium]|jgi:putative Holliday junction resolvase|nr:Holliday junction resolvase RuvX [Syntrophorhabdaceae bacterium]MDI9562282.1 Holliday junction resolvase RuvX [Pseudomonadota bacterium]OQC49158.1 MAG: putative Holliday junction resolvase [Deltaproteobacteria bacterium ADurb.Bin026]MBV6504485.1 putative pre-16S rRNA nuclease [Syntrophorhabdaceae bacterium]HNQ62701.1 Holliday junction resolvase RuvX [Syntrophorhabdaceae bacterium]